MKCHDSAQKGQAMDTYSAYLTQKNFDSSSFSGDLDLVSLLNALAFRAKTWVTETFFSPKNIQETIVQGYEENVIILEKYMYHALN